MRQVTQDTNWGIDKYVIMEATEIASVASKHASHMQSNDKSWYGGSYSDLVHYVTSGDESLVQKSEDMLSKIEDQMPVSRGWRVVEDVVGGVPNVPAFLAGVPQHMRRRQRVAKDNAPITIVVDLTSGVEIRADDVMRRGIALLALVRLLVEHRPVSLWASVAQNVGTGSGSVLWRIDTTPMDLARAAYMVASSNIARRFGYGVNRAVNGAGGGWPFRSTALHHQTAQSRLERVLGGEVCYVPSIGNADPLARDPVGWLKRTMSKLVATSEEE